jgi:hypothetical protein
MASSRNIGMLAMLALTLAAAWYVTSLEQPEDPVAEPTERSQRRPVLPQSAAPESSVGTTAQSAASSATPMPAATLSALASTTGPAQTQQRMAPRGKELFPVRSWQPPPPPPPPVAVVVPRAPPLPFRYLGRIEEDGQVVVFVGEGTTTRVLRKGQTLANYRVEEVTAQSMRLVYLPLNETQRLLFESKN